MSVCMYVCMYVGTTRVLVTTLNPNQPHIPFF